MSILEEPVRRRACAVALSACLVTATSAATVGVAADSASAQQQVAAKRLEAKLRPSGDPNGSGEATFRLSKAQRRVCANVEWQDIGTPNAAHIHRSSDGGIVVDLTGSVTGGSHCATNVSRKVIGKILKRPGRYYFNVHNATYPSGAIQGTLRR
jgi:hypothetical protein